MTSSSAILGRRTSLPIAYVTGNYYDVGFDVGRTFSSLIQSYLKESEMLKEHLLPAYHTPVGKHTYELTLASLREHMPHYLEELRGTAEGADVPFYKLFLLHLEEMMTSSIAKLCEGCTSIISKQPGEVILGHTQDSLPENLNHCYMVSATILESKTGKVQEKFTAFCYPGMLPGNSMSYNYNGMVSSINSLSCVTPQPGRTPRTFLMRALLAAKNLDEARHILADPGYGVGNGVSVNLVFASKNHEHHDCHNLELAPSSGERGSILSDVAIVQGENLVHCNTYLRLQSTQSESSEHRYEALLKLPAPYSRKNILQILGDQSDPQYPFFRSARNPDRALTVAVGIFDINARNWAVHVSNPKTSSPLIVLPLKFNFDI